jgi:hypothetical protein
MPSTSCSPPARTVLAAVPDSDALAEISLESGAGYLTGEGFIDEVAATLM